METVGPQRTFAVVILDDEGNFVKSYSSVPLHKLIRIIWEIRPKVLAVDNIHELAESEDELGRVLSMLPEDLTVIQPTRMPDGRFVDLKKLAKLAGVEHTSGKLTPSKTAYLAALLALKGYGSRVKFVEEKTRIVITRNRRLKHGGTSNPRFQRRIRSAILRAVKDVRRLLDREGLDYDLVFRKSGGGLDSAVFVVYAPRSKLTGLVKPHLDPDIRIEVKPVYSSRVEFETKTGANMLGSSKPHVIVGVDPGISVGLAAVSLDGELLFALSRRNLDRGEAISIILERGVPVMVATDVTPAPDYAKKLAASLGVPLYEPKTSLSVEEKRSLVEEYIAKYPGLAKKLDTHSRDALAAALTALRHHEQKLRQVESYLAKLGIDLDLESVKANVLRGVTIAEAVEDAIKSKLAGIVGESYTVIAKRRASEGVQPPQQDDSTKLLHRELELLRAQNALLREELAKLEERVKALENANRLLQLEFDAEVKRDKAIQMLSNRLKGLSAELDRTRDLLQREREAREAFQKAIFKVASGQMLPALVSNDVSTELVNTVQRIRSETGVKPAIVLLSPTPANFLRNAPLIARDVAVILVKGSELSKLEPIARRLKLPICTADEHVVEFLADGEVALVTADVLLDAYQRMAEWENEEERKALTLDQVKRMLEEYRAARAKMLLGLKNRDTPLNEHAS